MKKCRSCLTRADTEYGICPVCGIDQEKARKDLTPEEKRIRHAARHIHLVALLHLVGAGIGILMIPDLPRPWVSVALSAISATLAVGLFRYDLWAYKAAVVCYFALGMVNIIAVNILAIPAILLLLYVVGNKHAKAIFERQLPQHEQQ